MAGKDRKRVDLERLAAALRDYPFGYLITVDDGYRAHTVAVRPVLRTLPDAPGAILDVGPVGGKTRANISQRDEVTLLWPPVQPGGYSLIVDGRAELSDYSEAPETALLRVSPTRALLHRSGDVGSGAEGPQHDCVVFSLPA